MVKLEIIDYKSQCKWTTQASFWTPKRTETYKHPNRLSKSEAKNSISEDEKKAVIIIIKTGRPKIENFQGT